MDLDPYLNPQSQNSLDPDLHRMYADPKHLTVLGFFGGEVPKILSYEHLILFFPNESFRTYLEKKRNFHENMGFNVDNGTVPTVTHLFLN